MEETEHIAEYVDNINDASRPMPNSSEAERAILGAILLDNGLIAQATSSLRDTDFYVPSHRLIFAAMVDLFMYGKEINPILIGEELRKTNSLERVGGFTFLSNLTYGLPHTTNLTHYAEIVTGKSALRRLIKVGYKFIENAYEQEDEPAKVIEAAGKEVFDVVMQKMGQGFKSISELSKARVQKARDIRAKGKAITGVSSGFIDIDKMTGGFEKGDLIILAGRPSMGKTALSLGICSNMALRNPEKPRVAYCSLEMSEDSITARIICSEAEVDLQNFRNGYLSDSDWQQIEAVEKFMSENNPRMVIDDTPGISIVELKAKLKRLIIELGELAFVVVDSIQLMSGSGKTESRQQEVSKISRELKALAKELNVPLMAISTLNRKPEERSDHRPVLADLRESGQLEFDADVVMFVYREDQYKIQANNTELLTHTAEIIFAKQRNGPTGTEILQFDAPTARFRDAYVQ